MKNWCRRIVSILTGLTVATVPLIFAASAEPVRGFIEFIATLDRAQPADRKVLERLIGRALQCTEDPVIDRIDCGARDLELSGVKVGNVDFRSTRNSESIIILDNLSGECIPVDDLDKRFGPGDVHSSCTDGGICIYREYNRSWGQLSVGLGRNGSAKCANSIIMQTAPH
jgi:hypothetical protein